MTETQKRGFNCMRCMKIEKNSNKMDTTLFFLDNVKTICFLLVRFEEFDIARTLQTTLESFQTSIILHKSIVWPIFVSILYILNY